MSDAARRCRHEAFARSRRRKHQRVKQQHSEEHEGRRRREAIVGSHEGKTSEDSKAQGRIQMKQFCEIERGVTRQGVEKTRRRCTAGGGKPGAGRCARWRDAKGPENLMGG